MSHLSPPLFFGSSPLTRGKPWARRSGQTGPRLIPAHAGKTIKAGTVAAIEAAHPHSRGENVVLRQLSGVTAGSSPLTRGKLGCASFRYKTSGLIPAHAGKTDAGCNRHRDAGAHPRSRGENDGTCRSGSLRMGSSPLTRGKHRSTSAITSSMGLIPAHAGKTHRSASLVPGIRAHPRSRGENAAAWTDEVAATGSSPLTRGKRRGDCDSSAGARLIPAHAGKTVGKCGDLVPLAAHPRSRGENDGRLVGVRRDAGSSPLTRGKLLGIAWSVFQVRLIPAHAGKTRPYLACCAGGAAHPRSRGENESNETMALPLSGSSPLTRGKPQDG